MEIFCQRKAKGDNNSQAAREAGYSERNPAVAANKLLQRQDIKERITELRERVSEHVVHEMKLSKDWVLTELQTLYTIAKRKEQVTPATRCLELVGKELGMFQDVIPREIFTLMMSLMGTSVSKHVTDSAVLERIVADWEIISVAEPKQLKSGMILPGPAASAEVNMHSSETPSEPAEPQPVVDDDNIQ